jgi:hypothetical protein
MRERRIKIQNFDDIFKKKIKNREQKKVMKALIFKFQAKSNVKRLYFSYE